MKKLLLAVLFVCASFSLFAQTNALPRLAVVEFSGNAPDDAATVREMVERVMIDSGKFKIVDSNNIDEIIAQQNIALTDIGSDENITKLKRENISYIVTGTVRKQGAESFVSLKILDVLNAVFIPNSPGGVVDMSSMTSIYRGVSGISSDFLSRMSSQGGTVARKVIPPVPQNVRTETRGTDSVVLSWDNAGDGISYRLYYNTTNDPQRAKAFTEQTSTSNLMRDFSADTYYFWVTSLRDGLESEKSTVAAVKIVLPAPQNVQTGTAGTDSVLLFWNSAGDGISYQVYYSTENNPQQAPTYGNRTTGTSITIQGLSVGTTYYFWVSSWKGGQESIKSTMVPVKIGYVIGDRGPAGGWVFYDKGNKSDGWRYLEAAPEDLVMVEWGWSDFTNNRIEPAVSGTSTKIGSGKRNTQLIVDALQRGAFAGKAAQLCTFYGYGGYADWFLPSMEELVLMYTNLAEKGAGGFTGGWYWSSSVSYYSDRPVLLNFSDGREVVAKIENPRNYVRPIRAF